MWDIKVIKTKDFTKITQVDYLSREDILKFFPETALSKLPAILSIEGEHFYRATDVLLNGTSLVYEVLSSTRLIAIVPEHMLSRSIESLIVLTDKENFSVGATFSFELDGRFELINGMNKVTAQFIKVLLTTPGSDAFDKSLGVGIHRFAGKNSKASWAVLTRVATAIHSAVIQIGARQNGLKIPPKEKLKNAEIITIDYAKGDPTSIEIRLKLSTHGETGFPVSLVVGAQSLVEELVTSLESGGSLVNI